MSLVDKLPVEGTRFWKKEACSGNPTVYERQVGQ